MDAAAVGRTQEVDREQSMEQQDIFDGMVLGLPALTRHLCRRGLGADDAPCGPRIVKIFELAFLLEVTPLPSPAFRLVFHPTITDTYRQERRQRRWGEAMGWKQLLAYITGTVDQELLLRNEYLVTENRILRNQIPGRVQLTDGERITLAEIGQKLGKQALQEVATIVKPDTILAWHRKLVAQKFDGSQQRKAPGRPTIEQELETLVIRMAPRESLLGL
jgi:hypothetical protein